MRPRTSLVTLVMLAACGTPFTARSTSGDAGAGDSAKEACATKTCEQLGWQCSLGMGLDPDGCGGMLDCGTCGTAGYVCSPTHECKCQPLTCKDWDASCGEVPDGCGGVAQCGTCPGGMTCSGASGALTCVTGTCTPQPCPTGECGQVPDGCGGIANCTTVCAAPDTCGGGGTKNQCGCSAQDPCEEYGLGCGTAVDACGVQHTCGPAPTHVATGDSDCVSGVNPGVQYYDCCQSSIGVSDGGASGLGPIQPACLGKLLAGPAPSPEPAWTCAAYPPMTGAMSATAWCCTKE